MLLAGPPALSSRGARLGDGEALRQGTMAREHLFVLFCLAGLSVASSTGSVASSSPTASPSGDVCSLAEDACACASYGCAWAQAADGGGICFSVAGYEGVQNHVDCFLCPTQEFCPDAGCMKVPEPCACAAMDDCRWDSSIGCVARVSVGTPCSACQLQAGCQGLGFDTFPSVLRYYPEPGGTHTDGLLTVKLFFDVAMAWCNGQYLPRFWCEGSATEHDIPRSSVVIAGSTVVFDMSEVMKFDFTTERTCGLVVESASFCEEQEELPFPGIERGAYAFRLMDNVVPRVADFEPQNGGLSVPIDGTIRIKFSEPIALGPSSSSLEVTLISLDEDRSGTFVRGTVAFPIAPPDVVVDGLWLEVKLTGRIKSGILYSLVLPDGAVVDLYGNVFLGLPAEAYKFRAGSQVSSGTSGSGDDYPAAVLFSVIAAGIVVMVITVAVGVRYWKCLGKPRDAGDLGHFSLRRRPFDEEAPQRHGRHLEVKVPTGIPVAAQGSTQVLRAAAAGEASAPAVTGGARASGGGGSTSSSAAEARAGVGVPTSARVYPEAGVGWRESAGAAPEDLKDSSSRSRGSGATASEHGAGVYRNGWTHPSPSASSSPAAAASASSCSSAFSAAAGLRPGAARAPVPSVGTFGQRRAPGAAGGAPSAAASGGPQSTARPPSKGATGNAGGAAAPDPDAGLVPEVRGVKAQLQASMSEPLVVRKKLLKDLMLEYHPDKNSGANAKDVFQYINNAKTWFLLDA